MKKSLFVFALVVISLQLVAQKKSQSNEIRVPLNAASWDSKNGELKFGDRNGVPAMELTSGGQLVTARNLVFSSGTIEFDVEFMGGFTGVYFRRESEQESEFFYLRDRAGDPVKMDAVQYAPIIKNVNLWDMLPEYQTAANFSKDQWTHVKLVVSGSQMLVYVNDKARPTLQIGRLEGNTKQGSIAFTGKCFISNLVVKHNDVEGLAATEGFDPTYHDNRYIRSWQVSQPTAFPRGQDLTNDNLPDIQTTWQNIAAERRGLVNLTRLYGESNGRRVAWLRTKVVSKREQKIKLDFGFSDEVWVFVNDRLVLVDKNIYTQDARKKPEGRISVDNTEFEIPLKEGENDLVIGIANDFYGWGVIARVQDLDGITLNTDYKQEVVNKEFEPFFGMYSSKQIPLKVKVSQKNEKLMLFPVGQGPLAVESAGNGVFKHEAFGLVFEFVASEKKMTLKEGGQAIEFFKE